MFVCPLADVTAKGVIEALRAENLLAEKDVAAGALEILDRMAEDDGEGVSAGKDDGGIGVIQHLEDGIRGLATGGVLAVALGPIDAMVEVIRLRRR
jgi:hypothetical protein